MTYPPPLYDGATGEISATVKPGAAAPEERSCPAGTFVYVPRATPHTFKVTSSEPGKKLNLFAPAAIVGFFEELAAAEAAGNAEPELLDQIARRNHMKVLGPVPETYL